MKVKLGEFVNTTELAQTRKLGADYEYEYLPMLQGESCSHEHSWEATECHNSTWPHVVDESGYHGCAFGFRLTELPAGRVLLVGGRIAEVSR